MTSLSNLTYQELNELAAVECMKFRSAKTFDEIVGSEDIWVDSHHIGIAKQSYRPCQNAEQTMDLAERYEMEICFSDKLVSYKDYSQPNKERDYSWNQLQFKTGDWKRAVVIAAILSERGE